MVTVVFCYAQCNEPKVQIAAVREGRALTVSNANAVLRAMTRDQSLYGSIEIAVLLDGDVAFKDVINVSGQWRGYDMLTSYLQEIARHYDGNGCIEKRNSILCLLGAIALDEAE